MQIQCSDGIIELTSKEAAHPEFRRGVEIARSGSTLRGREIDSDAVIAGYRAITGGIVDCAASTIRAALAQLACWNVLRERGIKLLLADGSEITLTESEMRHSAFCFGWQRRQTGSKAREFTTRDELPPAFWIGFYGCAGVQLEYAAEQIRFALKNDSAVPH